MQAAVDGVIDFSRADLLDPRWYRHVDLLLDGLDRRLDLEVLRTEMQIRMTYVSCASPQTFDAKNRALVDLWQPYVRRVLHLPSENQPSREKMVSEGRAAWERAYGSLADPQVQAKIDAVAASLRRQRDRQAA